MRGRNLNSTREKARHEPSVSRKELGFDTLGQVPRALCFLSHMVFVSLRKSVAR